MLLKTQCGNAYTFYDYSPAYPLGHPGCGWCEWVCSIYSPHDSFQVREVGNPDDGSIGRFLHVTSSALGKVCLLRNCHICMRVFSRFNLLDTLKSGAMTLQSYNQKRLRSEHAVVNSAGSVKAHTDHGYPEPRVLSFFLLVWLSLYLTAL